MWKGNVDGAVLCHRVTVRAVSTGARVWTRPGHLLDWNVGIIFGPNLEGALPRRHGVRTAGVSVCGALSTALANTWASHSGLPPKSVDQIGMSTCNKNLRITMGKWKPHTALGPGACRLLHGPEQGSEGLCAPGTQWTGKLCFLLISQDVILWLSHFTTGNLQY